MSRESILIINAGSSNIKISLFDCDNLDLIFYSKIEKIFNKPELTVYDEKHHLIFKQIDIAPGYKSSLQTFFKWFQSFSHYILIAVGHRILYGGQEYLKPVFITDEVVANLTKLIPLAPLHEQHNINAIKIVKNIFPKIRQVACFDTSFHRTQLKLASRFAIPRSMTDEGLIRYGFHGISYEYIASVIPNYLGVMSREKIIVAHLGNGASMCAMHQLKSAATTMGLTALDGLMMGTRCGNIDPGLILYLLQQNEYTVEKVTQLLYEQSGLLGVSEISSDIRVLEQNKSPNATEAIQLFCYQAARELSALIPVLNGCDAIVFTAGIGENSAFVRKGICEWLKWLGAEIDDKANEKNLSIISKKNSKVCILVIPTNEEYMIAKHTLSLVKGIAQI